MSTLVISPLFVAVFALIQVPLTVAVALRRGQTGVAFFDGGDTVLGRRMRAHANFTETVPMVLLAMAAAEYMGAPRSVLIGGGLSLLCGRAVHYLTLVRSGVGPGRAIGMILTLAPMVIFGSSVLSHLGR
jgi:uncharacterized membrane protein YecN with MAPEG domain